MSARRRVAVLKGGRSLERAVSLRSGAHVQDALLRLGHDVVAIDAGPELVAELLEADARRRIRRHARARRRGRHHPGPARGARASPTPGRAPAACMRATNKVLAKHLMREAGIPTPAFHAFRETSIREFGAGAAMTRVEADLGFPLVVKPASGGSALGVKFASAERGASRRARGRLLLRPHGADRALREGPRPGGVGDRRPRARIGPAGAARRRGGAARGGLLRLRVAL